MGEELVGIKKDRIKTFDAVRGLATLIVFVFHTGYLLPFADATVRNRYSEFTFINWHRAVYILGTVGVSIFFVLSGFLLFYQLYKNKEKLTRKKLWVYSKKRMLRIFPLYYFSLFFIIFFLKADIFLMEDGFRSIIYNLLFVRGINGGGSITINNVYWTLIIELHFYILLPIFYYFFCKYKKITTFLILVLLGLVYRVSVAVFLDNPSMQFLRLTPANFDFFAFGMLGAYLYIEQVKWLSFVKKNIFQFFISFVFLLFIYLYDLDFLPTLSYIFAPTLFGIITTLVILSFTSNENSSLAKAFNSRPLLFLAKISFSVYVWHTIVIEKVENLAIANGEKFLLISLITLIISTATYYLVEYPFLKYKENRFKTSSLGVKLSKSEIS